MMFIADPTISLLWFLFLAVLIYEYPRESLARVRASRQKSGWVLVVEVAHGTPEDTHTDNRLALYGWDIQSDTRLICEV